MQQAHSDDVYTESMVFTMFTHFVWQVMLSAKYRVQLRLIEMSFSAVWSQTKVIRRVTF